MESLKEFRDRAEKVLNEIINESLECSEIAIVSHGKMIERLYRSFKCMDYNVNDSYPTGDTGIHIWEINGQNRSVIISNYTGHLK